MALPQSLAAALQLWRHLIKPAAADALRRLARFFTICLTWCAGSAVFMFAADVPPTPAAAETAIYFSISVSVVAVFVHWWLDAPRKLDAEPSPIARAYRRFRHRRGMSQDDLKRIAYHEVGHLLSYAVITTTIPGTLVAELVNDRDWKHQGLVSAELYDAKTTHNLYARGMKLLAGIACERYFKFPESLGYADDYAKWQLVAEDYLITVRPGSEWFFVHPRTQAHVDNNARLMNELESKQLADLAVFFDANVAWIHEQAAILLRKRRIGHKQIRAMLESAVVPPQLTWSYP